MKIHIIGGSGTGKTYLADALSKKYNIPHFDLDDLQWDNTADEYGIKMPVDRRDSLLLIHALWIVSIHGENIISSFLTPIVLVELSIKYK